MENNQLIKHYLIIEKSQEEDNVYNNLNFNITNKSPNLINAISNLIDIVSSLAFTAGAGVMGDRDSLKKWGTYNANVGNKHFTMKIIDKEKMEEILKILEEEVNSSPNKKVNFSGANGVLYIAPLFSHEDTELIQKIEKKLE